MTVPGNTAEVEVRIAEVRFGSADYARVTELRRDILRRPLGLDFTPAELARERDDVHVAAFADERVVGTLLLRTVDPRIARLMRMAVDERMQGRAIGSRLVEHAETSMRGRGFELLMMHARCTAAAFYVKLGYVRVGDEFLEQGVPHVRMEKPL